MLSDTNVENLNFVNDDEIVKPTDQKQVPKLNLLNSSKKPEKEKFNLG